jgi:hypothetical protein
MGAQEERQINAHLKALSGHYLDSLKEMRFKPPYVDPKDRDSVISLSLSKKEAFISKHYIPGHYLSDSIHYAVILKDELLNRL